MRCCGIFTVCVTGPLLWPDAVGSVFYLLLRVDSLVGVLDHEHPPSAHLSWSLCSLARAHLSVPRIITSLGTLLMLTSVQFPNHSGKRNYPSSKTHSASSAIPLKIKINWSRYRTGQHLEIHSCVVSWC